MDTDTRRDDPALTDHLDLAIPHPDPTTDPTTDLAVVLRSGRRALRRRRATSAAVSLAVVAALGTGATLLGPGSPGAVDGATVAAAAPSSSSAAAGPAAAPSEPIGPGDPAPLPVRTDPSVQGAPALSPDGAVLLPDGFTVLEQVPNPKGLAAPAYSVALSYTAPAEITSDVRWTMLTLRPDWRTDGGPVVGVEEDGSSGWDTVADTAQGQTFTEWVQAQVQLGEGPLWPEFGLPDEAYLTPAGALVLPEGAREVARVENPLGLPAPRSSLAVAWVGDASTGGLGGEQWSLLVVDPGWTPQDGAPGLVNGFGRVVRPAQAGTDLAAWVDAQVQRGFTPDPPPAWVGG